jgi:hypothetical protein
MEAELSGVVDGQSWRADAQGQRLISSGGCGRRSERLASRSLCYLNVRTGIRADLAKLLSPEAVVVDPAPVHLRDATYRLP